MIEKVAVLLLILALQSRRVLGDDGDVQEAGVNDKCAEYCSKTYAAHTSESSNTEQICRQGCRLYSMIQFSNKLKPVLVDDDDVPKIGNEVDNSTAVVADCELQCGQAYSDSVFKSACEDGCRHQTPFTNGRVRIVVDGNSPVFPLANKMLNDAMGKIDGQFEDMRQRMKSNWNRFRNWVGDDNLNLDSDTDTQKSFQRMSDGLFNLVDKLMGKQSSTSSDQGNRQILLGGPEDVADHERHRIFTSHPKHILDEPKGATVGNEDDNGMPVIIVKMLPDPAEPDNTLLVSSNGDLRYSNGDNYIVDPNDTWLACLARRMQNLSTLARWLLCAALMMSIICMMWLCLALMRSHRGRRHRMYMQYRAGKDDMIYFTPPPVYEKSSAAYVPLAKDQKAPPSPPPSYKEFAKDMDVEKQDKTESA